MPLPSLFPFLFSIRYLVPKNDLRFFVALAGMFPAGIHRLGVPAGIHRLGVPANRYVPTCGSNKGVQHKSSHHFFLAGVLFFVCKVFKKYTDAQQSEALF